MKERLFEEFQKYVKETFGYDVKNVDADKSMTFDRLFGGSFIESKKSLRLPDTKVDMLKAVEYSNMGMALPKNFIGLSVGFIITENFNAAA